MPKYSDDKKQLSYQINERFLTALYYLMRMKAVSSIKDYCDQTGDKINQIFYMEKGQRFPTLEMAANMCLKMGVSETYLFRGEGPIMNEDTVLKRIAIIEEKLRIPATQTRYTSLEKPQKSKNNGVENQTLAKTKRK